MSPLHSLFEVKEWNVKSVIPLSGGSINKVFKVELEDNSSFVIKQNDLDKYPSMFEREGEGLLLLHQSLFRVPQVIDVIAYSSHQFLIEEFIKESSKSPLFWRDFAFQLSHLHQITSENFGDTADNFLGALRQSNKSHYSWTTFYMEERLLPQLNLSVRSGFLNKEEAIALSNKVEQWLNRQPLTKPSLVHGDLWSGNFMT